MREKTKPTTKRSQSRLQPVMGSGDLIDVIQHVHTYGYRSADGWIELRPRTSGREEDWAPVPEDQEDLWNTEAYNYRIGEAPRLVREGNQVFCGSESVTMDEARNIVRAALRARKSKKDIYLAAGEEGGADGFEVRISSDGSTGVGCEGFNWEEIHEFAKKEGLLPKR